jgi:hypothetical protein
VPSEACIVGEDRTEEAVKKFFTEEMGRRRCHTLRVVLNRGGEEDVRKIVNI